MSEYQAKSLIIDIADNWGDSNRINIRSIECYDETDTLIPITAGDISAYATSTYSGNTDPSFVFITAISKIDGYLNTSWMGAYNSTTNQRLICVFDSSKIITRIVVNNGHNSGTEIDWGIKNTKWYVSTDEITDTTYDAAILNSTLIYEGVVTEHTASNIVDDQELELIVTVVALTIIPPEATIPIVCSSEVQINLITPEATIPIVGSSGIDEGFFIVSGIGDISVDSESNLSIIIKPEEITIPILSFGNFAGTIVIITPEAIIPIVSESEISVFSMSESIVRYLLTITGAADGVENFELPMSSFQARRKSGDATYLSVVIPTLDYSAEITERSNGTIVVEQAYKLNDAYAQREKIIEVEIDNITSYEGGKNQSIILDGYKTTTYIPKSVNLSTATYKAISNGKIRYRLAEPNIFLNPGDTVTVEDDTFIIGVMNYIISTRLQQIELEEA